MSKAIEATVSHFSIDLPFLRSEYEVLTTLGEYTKKENNIYHWTFPLAVLDKVEVALADIIQFDADHTRNHVVAKCDVLLEELRMSGELKGKSGITVIKDGDGYVLTEFRRGKEITHYVTKALVKQLWEDVFGRLNAGERYESKHCWEKIVRSLEKSHWNYALFDTDGENDAIRQAIKQGQWNHARSGRVNTKYLNGDRGYYFKLCYYPMKTLHALGLINYPPGKKYVVRVAEPDDFDNQARITEVIIQEEAVERAANRPEHPDNITSWAEAMK